MAGTDYPDRYVPLCARTFNVREWGIERASASIVFKAMSPASAFPDSGAGCSLVSLSTTESRM